jgi:pterin-4a-carbinolamine dehydratase
MTEWRSDPTRSNVAEELNHHPDILVHGWSKVRLTLSTHSEAGSRTPTTRSRGGSTR